MIIGILWAPLRFSILLGALLFGWFSTKLLTIGVEFHSDFRSVQQEPKLSPLRRRIMWACQWLTFRAIAIGLGIYRMKVTGLENKDPNARISIYGPHQSIIDGAIMLAMSEFGKGRSPTGMSAAVERNRPLLSIFSISLEFIFVDYNDDACRRAAVNGSKLRASSPAWDDTYQIFAAEGTTSSGRQFLQLKKGAFIPGQPVQPYLLQLPEWMDELTGFVGKERNSARGAGWAAWTEDSNMLQLIWHQFTTPWQPYHVHILPAVYPSAAEKKDAALYANNVQKQISEYSGHEISNCNNNDLHLAQYILKKFPRLKYDDFIPRCHALENEFGTKAISRGFLKEVFEEFIGESYGETVINGDTASKALNREINESIDFTTFLRYKVQEKCL